nr:putative neural-cadherin 2 [Procambarus clarkii]
MTHAIVQVEVDDVNDNPPYFLRPEPTITVIEEDDRDLPLVIAKVEARDRDRGDRYGLRYSLRGDGVDGLTPNNAFFTINPLTGELLQLRALDRDPPDGKGVWKVTVQVRDSQETAGHSGSQKIAVRSQRQETTVRSKRQETTVRSKRQETTVRSGRQETTVRSGRQEATVRSGRQETTVRSGHQETTVSRGTQKVRRQNKFDRLTQTPYAATSRSQDHLETRRERETETPARFPISQVSQETWRDSKGEEVRPSHPTPSFSPQLEKKRKYKESDERHQPIIPLSSLSHTSQQGRKRRKRENGNERGYTFPATPATVPRSSRIILEDQSEARAGPDPQPPKGSIPSPFYLNKMEKTKLYSDYSPSFPGRFKYIYKHANSASARAASLVINDTDVKNIEALIQPSFSPAISTSAAQLHRKVTTLQQSIPSKTFSEKNSLVQTKNKKSSVLFSTILNSGKVKKTSIDYNHNCNSKTTQKTITSRTTVALNARVPSTASNITKRRRYFAYATHNTDSLINVHNITSNNTHANKTFNPRGNNMVSNRVTEPATTYTSLGAFVNTDTTNLSRSVPRDTRSANYSLDDQSDNGAPSPQGGGCEETGVFVWGFEDGDRVEAMNPAGAGRGRGRGRGGGRVHLVETVVTIMVKDINDNPPVFSNTTMFGEVQENGPIDLSVAVISAWDADDATEGTNARLTYAIEKNVIDERSGEAIFAVHPETGLVRTALCCLDRETTPEYHIQVVAADGGGLKGTGTVVVRLADVNDNSPRLARREWQLEVEETWGDGPPGNDTILEIASFDPDTTNYFSYRVVEASGWGWEHFEVRAVEGGAGQLYATRTLDYEDETHRRGFRFLVQVTDMGRGGWHDPRHLDAAWVSVRLKDVNDNPPAFHRPLAHVTIREDTAPGTLLATLPARDPDMEGRQEVEYRLQGGWDAVTVDGGGDITLARALDRESPGGTVGEVKLIAVDGGIPPLSSTATLIITVNDVNDCPPRLLSPTVFHVPEGATATLLGVLKATDDDVWALGHGPPFNLSLAPTNQPHVLTYIKLKFNRHLDSGRGGAEVWAEGGVDREEHRELRVEVLVVDAGGLAALQTVTVIVDDINDNPMKPAAKTVYLWKPQGGGSDAPLGRVYVEDPDDWDLGDKSFKWAGTPHPLFTLSASDGAVFASSLVTEGRYDLQFLASDRVWGQRGVEANMTVLVRLLAPDALAHATPLTLTPTTPAHLTRGWTPTTSGGGLGRLVAELLRLVGEQDHIVDVISVYDLQDAHHHPRPSDTPTIPSSSTASFSSAPTASSASQQAIFGETPSACVWLTVRSLREGGPGGSFMNPVKLQGLLGLHSRQLEAATNLTVLVGEPASWSSGPRDTEHQQGSTHLLEDDSLALDPSSAASRASTALTLQVVDTNTTALVTPHLTHAHTCYAHEPETCTPTSCLNGGRCVGSPTGKRCVCPGGSWGARCKMLSRTFSGSGWAWVDPFRPCLPTTLSIRLLTRRPHALLLYSGPMAPTSRRPHSPPTPMIALQLVHGRPQLVVEGRAGSLSLNVNATLHDGDWHSIHLYFSSQGVALMADLCGRGWDDSHAHDDAHCVARGAWPNREGAWTWAGHGPVQVGGLAHPPPRPHAHGWRNAPEARPLDGCLSHLTVNGQLVDLGEPAYSHGSEVGCAAQDTACAGGGGGCGVHGRCVGGMRQPECECEAGWAGPGCASPTQPSYLAPASYMKAALSFTPPPRQVTAQVRVRTRGATHGLLLRLSAHQGTAAFTIHLRAGVACASVTGVGWAEQTVCVEGRPVGDGRWHTLTAQRLGDNLLVAVDDGDSWSRRNDSLPRLSSTTPDGAWPPPLAVDKHDAATLGGLPEFVGVRLVAVHHDLNDTCVDDVRVCGRALPLPPAVNGTSWGQVTTLEGLKSGCPAPDGCNNTTCPAPLSCTPTWGQSTCSCGPGRQQAGRGCEDVDECQWAPCLHGGSCHNRVPGFLCVCSPDHAGQFCQWKNVGGVAHPLTLPAAVVGLTLSFLILIILGVVCSVRLRRRRRQQQQRLPRKGSCCEEGTFLEVKSNNFEDVAFRELQPDETQETLVECLKLRASCGKLNEAGEKSSEDPAFASMSKGSPDGGGRRLQPEVLLPNDDLRAYAYEGDGSSAGSLTSTISGLRVEMKEEWDIKPLVPEFLQVIDLLKNLPERSRPDVSSAGDEEGGRVKGSQDTSTAKKKESSVLSGFIKKILPSSDGSDHPCYCGPTSCGENSSRNCDDCSKCSEVSTRCNETKNSVGSDAGAMCDENSEGEVSTIC